MIDSHHYALATIVSKRRTREGSVSHTRTRPQPALLEVLLALKADLLANLARHVGATANAARAHVLDLQVRRDA